METQRNVKTQYSPKDLEAQLRARYKGASLLIQAEPTRGGNPVELYAGNDYVDASEILAHHKRWNLINKQYCRFTITAN